jgi:hypothetical protein
MMEWEEPENDDCDSTEEYCDEDDFGWYEVVSGVRYEFEEETFDFNQVWWSAEYRRPHEAATVDVQIQDQFEASSSADYTDASGNDKTAQFKQEMFVGYEIA